MALFRCRKFLGCLSLRTGVWLLALLAILVGGLGSAGSWLEVSWMAQHPLALRQKVATIIQAGVFSLLFLLSFLGFFAALAHKRGVVYIYSKFVFIHAPLIAIALAITLITTIDPDSSPDAVKTCLNGTTSTIISQFCNHGLSLVHILPIALLGAAVLIQFSAWIVASSYGEERDRKVDFTDSDLESSRSMLYPESPFAARR
ncbi:hypothetical protein MSAN_01024400 [Mycena sanguinolenta]|uniref:Uncharacterized protein n=1 Tax=Mycena sanguinolenta TaxID=230812 RepID=A0A8H7D6Y6_9AGAR|nr:hypothetical protein MSAN_01024400 [Mycena sanguinolenta]